MRRILTVTLLSLIFTSLQAQQITFDALKDGVTDDAEIKRELILNGFTKVTSDSDSDTDAYAWDYNEDKKTAKIWVNIKDITDYLLASFIDDGEDLELELEENDIGIYAIFILTSGHYIHQELTEEIVENCTFDGIGDNDELEYVSGYIKFYISSEDGNNRISVYPLMDKLIEDFMKAFEELELEEQEE